MSSPGDVADRKCGQYVCVGVLGVVVVVIWLVSGLDFPGTMQTIFWSGCALVPVVLACGYTFRCVAERSARRSREAAAHQNQLSGVTDPRQRRGSAYRDLHIDIPPPSDLFAPESPPPSYEASSFSKPVITPPPTYSAAVDLTASPPVWDVAAVHQPPPAVAAPTQHRPSEDPR